MDEYKLSNEELRKLQLIQLEMLTEVDRICRKCNIKYNIIAGTLLGAVRHGGYIPWDDDADVALLRPEYEKFREACKTELDKSRFYFQDHRNTKGYRWGYGKLRRKDTLFLRKGQEKMPYEQGVFIDIFPLDAVSDYYPIRVLQNLHCFVIRKLLWSEVGKDIEPNTCVRKLYKILSVVPIATVFRHYSRLYKRLNGTDYDKLGRAKWVRILTFPTPNRSYGYRKKWYAKSRYYTFEGKEFVGIAAANEYLGFKFGNYMELPPIEKRKVHPVSRLKL